MPTSKKPPSGPRGKNRDPKAPSTEVKSPPLAAHLRVARNSLIVQRKAEGWGWKEIAEEANLTPRQCQTIAQTALDSREVSLLKKDPVEIVEWMLQEHVNSHAGYLAVAAVAENHSDYIRAMKARDETLGEILKLLQAVGKLPRELGTLRYVVDFRGIAQEMIRKTEQLIAGDIVAEDLLVHLRYVLRLGETPMELIEGSATEDAA